MGYLKIVFFLIARHKDTMVGDWSQMAEFIGTQFLFKTCIIWNWKFGILGLISWWVILCSATQVSGGSDALDLSKAQGFKVSTFYSALRTGGDSFFLLSLFPWWATWRTRFPHQVCFSCGRQWKARFSQQTINRSGALLSLTGVACVSLMENHIFLYFWIAREL